MGAEEGAGTPLGVHPTVGSHQGGGHKAPRMASLDADHWGPTFYCKDFSTLRPPLGVERNSVIRPRARGKAEVCLLAVLTARLAALPARVGLGSPSWST